MDENDLGLDPPSPLPVVEGRPYHPNRTVWTAGTQYNFAGGAHELLLVFAGLTAEEVDAVRAGGTAEFGLLVDGPLAVLLFRFEGPRGGYLGWGEGCYNWWMVPAPHRVEPPAADDLTPESRVPLWVRLVDAGTGIVRVNRVLTLAPGFSRTLLRVIRAQVSAPVTQAEYNWAVDRLYRKYGNTDNLFLHPNGVLRCVGGVMAV